MPPGHCGLRFNAAFDLDSEVVPAGWHLRRPWNRAPVLYDIRPQTHAATLTVATRDLRVVELSVRVQAHPDPAKLPVLYRTFGLDAMHTLVPPLVHQVAKSTAAGRDSAALQARPDHTAADLASALAGPAREFNFCIDEVAVVGVTVRS